MLTQKPQQAGRQQRYVHAAMCAWTLTMGKQLALPTRVQVCHVAASPTLDASQLLTAYSVPSRQLPRRQCVARAVKLPTHADLGTAAIPLPKVHHGGWQLPATFSVPARQQACPYAVVPAAQLPASLPASLPATECHQNWIRTTRTLPAQKGPSDPPSRAPCSSVSCLEAADVKVAAPAAASFLAPRLP